MQRQSRGVLCLLGLCLTGAALLAQVSPSTGAIQGIVVDQSAAVMRDVVVTLNNQTLGISRQTKTQADGSFVFPLLPPSSNYEVSMTATGFHNAVLDNLTVRITEVTVANAKLQLGAATEAVTVQGDAQTVQTTSATLGAVVSSEVLVSIPLPTRSVFDLLGTDAGVGATLSSPANTITQSQQALFVAGSRATANNYMLNGVDANNYEFHTLAAGIVPIPNPDAVMQFRTQTSLYDATTGFSAGGNISLVTKAGTSKLHGSAYDFYRDTIFNAEDFFLNRAGAPRPVFQQNQFGFSLGGPARILPKTFWFVNYEGLRQKNGVQGSITGLLPVLPSTRTASALADAFGIPASAIDPVAVRYLNAKGPYGGLLWPTGTGAPVGQMGQFAYSTPVFYNSDQFNSRLDHDFGQSNHFSGTFFYSSGALDNPGGATSGLGQEYQYIFSNNNATINDTHIFRPNLINDFTYGATWNERDIFPVNNLKLSDVGMTRFNSSLIDQLPNILFTDQLSCCGSQVSINQTQHNPSYDLRDMVSYTKGKHAIRAGVEYRWQQFNYNAPLSRGSLTFSNNNLANSLYGRPANVADLAIRDFLIGAPISASVSTGLHYVGYRARDFVFFLQDDYRITRRLTFNLGLRYDHLGNNSEVHNNISNFDISRLSPEAMATGGAGLQAGFIAPEGAPRGLGTPGVSPSTLLNGPGKNFAPRVSFAYDVFGNGKLAVRGGYGIYYQRIGGGSTLQSYQNPPFALSAANSGNLGTQQLANPFPTLPLPDAFPIFPAFPTLTSLSSAGVPTYSGALLSVVALERDMKTPYTQQWNFTLQNEFLPGWTVETGYIGSHSIHLLMIQGLNNALFVNAANPGKLGLTTNSGANRNARVRVAGFGTGGISSITDNAKSFYDAFLLTVMHRFSKGLYFKAAYTFAKTLDNATSGTGLDIAGSSPGNQFLPDLNYGLADFDIRHRIVATYVYEIPSFKQRYLKMALGNWTLSGITTLQSGLPGYISQSIGSNSLTGTNGYGVVVPGCRLMTGGDPNDHLNDYLNYNCVATTPVLNGGQTIGPMSAYGGPGDQMYTITPGAVGQMQGTSTRGAYRGPFQRRWDVSLAKKFPISRFGEGANLEFRAEAFKVFNNPIFPGPSGNAAGTPSTFGKITSTIDNTGRQMQFALKLNF